GPAEVVRRTDQAVAEVMLPDAVHHDARGERVAGVGDFLSDLEPAAAGSDWGLILSRDRLQKAPRRRIAQALMIAANVDAHIVWVLVAGNGGEDRWRNVAQAGRLRFHWQAIS